MGFAHKKLAADYIARNSKGKALLSDAFPVQGSIATNCLNSDVTDSAAAATALSTGRKTNKGMVGMLPDGSKPETILEAVKSKLNMAAGIITTTALTHATPACFAAHVSSRGKEEEIALQLASSGVDFLAGGGIRYFLPKGYADKKKDAFGKTIASVRKDSKSPLDIFKKAGYDVFTGHDGAAAFANYTPAKSSRVLAAFTDYHTPYQTDIAGNPKQNTPSLDVVVGKAIETLSQNENGFFLIVEGGLIDQAAHINDAAGVVYETAALDKAIGTAYSFYKLHPGETLIVVTADHETGDLSSESPKTDILQNISISVDKLQSAYKGDTAAFYEVLSERFGLKSLDPSEKAMIDYAAALADAGKTASAYGGYSPPAIAASKILNNRSGIIFGSYSHTAKKVPFSAVGVKSEQLKGISDNAALGGAMFELLGIAPS